MAIFGGFASGIILPLLCWLAVAWHSRGALMAVIAVSAASILFFFSSVTAMVVLTNGDLVSCICSDAACLASLGEHGVAPSANHVGVVCAHPYFYRTVYYLGLILALGACACELALIATAQRMLAVAPPAAALTVGIVVFQENLEAEEAAAAAAASAHKAAAECGAVDAAAAAAATAAPPVEHPDIARSPAGASG